MTADKHDFREETHLNAAEFLKLKQLASDLGLSKSATLRHCLREYGNGGDLLPSDSALLMWIASEIGIGKKDALSFCINFVGSDLMRKRVNADTETLTEK